MKFFNENDLKIINEAKEDYQKHFYMTIDISDELKEIIQEIIQEFKKNEVPPLKCSIEWRERYSFFTENGLLITGSIASFKAWPFPNTGLENGKIMPNLAIREDLKISSYHSIVVNKKINRINNMKSKMSGLKKEKE